MHDPSRLTTPQMPSPTAPLLSCCHLAAAQKYSADEARSLKSYGELPETAKINETDVGPNEDGDCGFEFDNDADSDGSEDAGNPGAKDLEIDDI